MGEGQPWLLRLFTVSFFSNYRVVQAQFTYLKMKLIQNVSSGEEDMEPYKYKVKELDTVCG